MIRLMALGAPIDEDLYYVLSEVVTENVRMIDE